MVFALPASAYTPAMIGAAALVPPNSSQPDCFAYAVLSYTATPVPGSATAATSATARLAQPVATPACPASAGLYAEQPEPEPLHTVSDQPRVPLARLRVVPPTAVTYRDEAGYCTP